MGLNFGKLESTTLTTSTNDSDILLWEKSGTWDFTLNQPEAGSNDTGGWSTLDNWGGFASGNAFVRKLFVEGGYSTNGKKLGIFKFAWNGTGLEFRWSKTGGTPSPNSLADKIKENYDTAIAELYSLGYAVNPIGIIGSFGEGDTLSVSDNTEKAARKVVFEDFISDLRTDLSLNGETLKMFWNQLSDYDTATYNPSRTFGWIAVRDLMWEIFEDDNNAWLIDSDDADRPVDDIHYTALGREQIGVDKANAYLSQSFSEAGR